MKVYEFAKEIGFETIALMDKIRVWQLPIKSHMETLTPEVMDSIRTKIQSDQAESQAKTTVKGGKKKVVARKAVDTKSATEAATVKSPEKKVAIKKVVAKNESSTELKTEPKATTSKKVVVKKETLNKSDAGLGAKKTVAKKAATKKAVIRRVASHSPEAIAAAKAAEQEAQQQAAAAAAAEAVELESLNKEQETSAAAASPAKVGTAEEVKPVRRNIVGRMDLSRVTQQRRDSGPSGTSRPPMGASTTSQPGRTGPGRNIRTGFVAAQPFHEPVRDFEAEKAERDKFEEKKKPSAKGEEPVKQFTAADFRKREVIFQPKKKVKNLLNAKKTQITTPKAIKRIVKVEETITVAGLAQQMNLKAPELIKKLMAEGVMANINTSLDFDTVSLLVPDFGFEAQNVTLSESELTEKMSFGDKDAETVTRPPIVTVMGHVDHGKTTLLDAIRHADVASGEAGGITQHIGAYSVTLEDGKIATFLDTPGHAAFTQMRARGANVTDIAIIVVAADDGMMPQTEEAVSHAKAAKVPIIVAVNKIDKNGANPDRIKQQLAEKELVPEEWGGETIYAPVSALKKQGIKELIESIHLVAEVLELKANPNRSGTGVVIESKLEKGRGNVATVLIKDGSVKVGQFFAIGSVFGKIRNMTNDKGESVQVVGPGYPVEISGLENAPSAGDPFDVALTEDLARDLVALRLKKKLAEATNTDKMSLEAIFSKAKAGDLKELNVILKADVAGSMEAIRGVLEKLGTDEVKVKVVHSAVGGVTENDVLLASTSGGIVIGFNVRPDAVAQRVAKEKAVEIKTYNIIYNLSDDIKKAMAGLLKPNKVEETLGSAEVRETFSVPKLGTIAGCFVTNGKVTRASSLRLVREGRIIYEGKITSLKRFKDDAKEVASGYECGIGIENYNDIKVGDVIEAYITKEVSRTLE